MSDYAVVVERDGAMGLYVGSVPGWAGAHSQGETLDELRENMDEVISMLLEDGEPVLDSEFDAELQRTAEELRDDPSAGILWEQVREKR